MFTYLYKNSSCFILGSVNDLASADNIKPEVSSPTKPVTPSSEKYIPPHQKNLSPPTQGSSVPAPAPQHSTPPGFEKSSPPKTSGYHSNKSPNKNHLSPSMELKGKEPVNDFFPFETVSVYPVSPSSPVKSPEKGSNSCGPSQGYFSRSSSKYSADSEGYHSNSVSHNGRYMGIENSKEGHYRTAHNRTQDRSRFAANFDNLPTNTFEPSYLNNQSEYRVDSNYTSPSKSLNGRDAYRSPDKRNMDESGSSRPRPRLNIPAQDGVPFHPPRQHQDMASSNSPYSKPPSSYTAPGYYHSRQQAGGEVFTAYTSPSSAVKTHDTGRMGHSVSNNSSQYRNDYSSHASAPSYQDIERSHVSASRNSNNNHHQPPVKHSPTENMGKYYMYEHYKRSPESPESPAIAAFNFTDLDHTHTVSKDVLNERMKQEKLQALQEEQEDIVRETEEQAALFLMPRYGK